MLSLWAFTLDENFLGLSRFCFKPHIKLYSLGFSTTVIISISCSDVKYVFIVQLSYISEFVKIYTKLDELTWL